MATRSDRVVTQSARTGILHPTNASTTLTSLERKRPPGTMHTVIDRAQGATPAFYWYKGPTVYSSLEDSEAAPFIRAMMDAATDKDRDAARLVFSDWLEERGHPTLAAEWRHQAGGWNRWGDNANLSWWVPHMTEGGGLGGGTSHTLDWVAWPWLFPTNAWLLTDRCKDLVRAWLDNSVDLTPYPWAQAIARSFGANGEWPGLKATV